MCTRLILNLIFLKITLQKLYLAKMKNARGNDYQDEEYVKADEVDALYPALYDCDEENPCYTDSDSAEQTPEQPSPVNGEWGGWGSWSSCSVRTGNKRRERVCNNPAPANGGATCEGSSSDQASCEVNGGWGEWGSWSSCSSRIGKKERKRVCNNPAPRNGGATCQGSSSDEASCRVAIPEAGELGGKTGTSSNSAPSQDSCKCINPWAGQLVYQHIGHPGSTCLNTYQCYVSCDSDCSDKITEGKTGRCSSKIACPILARFNTYPSWNINFPKVDWGKLTKESKQLAAKSKKIVADAKKIQGQWRNFDKNSVTFHKKFNYG